MEPYTKISLTDVRVSARVSEGMRKGQRAQPLMVSVELTAAQADYLSQATPTNRIDVESLYDHVQNWRQRKAIGLIEDLVAQLVRASFALPLVNACRVSVTQLHEYDRASGLTVEAYVTRDMYAAGVALRHEGSESKMR